jgi:hypothetical protein
MLGLVLGVDFFRYCPHPAQLVFHAGKGVYSQRACLCGTGSGKTKCGLAEDVRWALDYPGSVGFIFEPSYPMMKRILFPTLEGEDFFGCRFPFTENPCVAGFSRGDMRLDWVNGSQWWFVSLDDPEKAEGPNVDYAHVDEARLVGRFDLAWLTVVRRLRGSGRCRVPVRPGVWLTTTADWPGSFLFDVTENPVTCSPGMRVYRWSIFENPTLPKEFLAEVVRTHTGGLADRFVYGRFASVSGGCLSFDSSKHLFELSDRGLIDRVCYGVDFGWSAPSAVVVNVFDSDGRAYAVDEFYKREVTDEELAEAAKDLQKAWGVGTFWCDARFPQSILKLCRAGLDAKPYSFRREDGLRELGSRLALAGDGRPRQFVSRQCVNLISELLEYRENVKENDHAVDALRYSLPLAKEVKPFLYVVRR